MMRDDNFFTHMRIFQVSLVASSDMLLYSRPYYMCVISEGSGISNTYLSLKCWLVCCQREILRHKKRREGSIGEYIGMLASNRIEVYSNYVKLLQLENLMMIPVAEKIH